ncbi:hypothetical protein BH24GEM1_BH24GEM1_15360 [soil metagenome]
MSLSPGAALLLIDVQQGLDEPRYGARNNPGAERRIAELLAAWRTAGRPVIHFQNDEANLNILDAGLAAGQATVFEADKARARRITFDDWRRRPRRERAVEWLAGLLRLQL